jgi:hypothetical protein
MRRDVKRCRRTALTLGKSQEKNNYIAASTASQLIGKIAKIFLSNKIKEEYSHNRYSLQQKQMRRDLNLLNLFSERNLLTRGKGLLCIIANY